MDYRKDAFVAVDGKGRRFMAVETGGKFYDRELHMMGQRKPVPGAKKLRAANPKTGDPLPKS